MTSAPNAPLNSTTPMSPLEDIRTRVGDGIREMLSGSSDMAERAQSVEDDPGLFGPNSATWDVHGNASMIIGGLRALLLQTLHPPTMAGVSDHSNYRSDPLGRLQRTGGFVGTTTFGTTDEAEQAIRVVRRVHKHVRGTTPQGVPYEATDPHLLQWVHCTEVDSFLRARERYGGAPLKPGDDDRYVAEMAVVAEKLGVLEPPASRQTLRTTLQSYRPELAVGQQARDTVRFLLWPPLSLAVRPSYGVIFAAAASMLPTFARRMLWLPVLPLAEPLAIRPAATGLMRTLGWALGEHPATEAVA